MRPASSVFIKQLIATAAGFYQPLGGYAWCFARGKLAGDPVFAHLLAAGLLRGHACILDIGCGQGLLSSWLLAAQAAARAGDWPEAWPEPPQTSRIRGLELMAQDVARADLALAAAVKAGQAEFIQADMCSTEFDQADAVVILDVLHYVSIAAQDAVLQRVRRALVPGGVLLLRVGDAAGGLGFHISSWVDRVVTMLRVHRLVTLHCRHLSAWQSALEGLGFMVEARAMSQGTLFANVLLIARLPAGTGEGLSRPGSLPEPGFAARLAARTGPADVGGAPPAACCGASLPLQRAVIGAGGAALLHASA